MVAPRLSPVSFIYLDVNSDPQSVNEILVSDIDAINTQIYNLFVTTVGEADFEPTLGSAMDNYLFDPNAQSIWDNMQFVLYRAFNTWMRERIKITPNDVVVRPNTEGRTVRLQVTYEYLQLGVRVQATMARPY